MHTQQRPLVIHWSTKKNCILCLFSQTTAELPLQVDFLTRREKHFDKRPVPTTFPPIRDAQMNKETVVSLVVRETCQLLCLGPESMARLVRLKNEIERIKEEYFTRNR